MAVNAFRRVLTIFFEYWLAGTKARFAFLFSKQETNAECEKEIEQNGTNSVNTEGSGNETRKYTRKKETKERRNFSDWRKAEARYGIINISLRLFRITIFAVEKQY
jgi:hypothetical protein